VGLSVGKIQIESTKRILLNRSCVDKSSRLPLQNGMGVNESILAWIGVLSMENSCCLKLIEGGLMKNDAMVGK